MRFWGAFVCILFLASPCVARAPAVSAESSASLRFFVQDFYNWYVPRFWKSSPKPAVRIALRRRALFSAELTAALNDHVRLLGKRRRASAAYLYDPILNAGDACERYRVGAISSEGECYRVDLYAVCFGNLRPTPAVTAELKRDGDRWVFVNFRYPHEKDFLAQAEGAREGRD